MDMYAHGEQRLVLYTAGAHEITRDVRVDTAFGARMSWHLSRFSRAFAGAMAAGFFYELGSDGDVIVCERTGEFVRPIDEDELPWMDISDFTSICIVLGLQLVRCCVRPAARLHPETIQGLLAVPPPDFPFLRNAHQPGYVTTYGELLEFVSPGGLGCLQQQGIRKGEVLVYCTPGGSALGAAAFITFASQTTCGESLCKLRCANLVRKRQAANAVQANRIDMRLRLQPLSTPTSRKRTQPLPSTSLTHDMLSSLTG